MDIKETRSFKVENQIINFNNLKTLADFLQGEKFKFPANSGVDLSSSATCEDTVVYSSESLSLFEDNSPLRLKRVKSVRMEFYVYAIKAKILIELLHGGGTWRETNISISGCDSDWVNGCLNRLQEIFSSFPPQNTFMRRHKNSARFVLALGFGSLIFWVLMQFPHAPSTEQPPIWLLKISELPLGTYVIKYALILLMGFFPAMYVHERLVKCWPSIELQIGPEHSWIESQRRRWLSAALIMGVIPFCINVLNDVVKNI